MASTDNNDLEQSNRQNANFNFNVRVYAFHAFVCALLLFLRHGRQLLKLIARTIVAYRLIIHLQLIANRLYQLARAAILPLLIIFLSTCGIAIASTAVNGVITSSLPTSSVSASVSASASAAAASDQQTALYYENDSSGDIATVQLKAIESIDLPTSDLTQTEQYLTSTHTDTHTRSRTHTHTESGVVNTSSDFLSAAAATTAYTVRIFDGAFITPATNAIITNQSPNTNANTNRNANANAKTKTNTNKTTNTITITNTNTNTNSSHTNSSITSNTVPAHSATNHLSTTTVAVNSEAVAVPSSSTTTLEATTEASAANADEFKLPSIQAILVSTVLLFVILGTVVGNVLVCIAVCMVRKLRRPCNYLLVSLALSDLCVAVLVMPMALLYEVLEKWNFGDLLCDIWVSFDVLCCTASILNLCAISVDRYLAITKPLEYGVKRTPRRMTLCVALVWLAAACISLPPLFILGNEHMDENGEPACAVCQNFAYQIYATLGSFYIPLAVMLFVYYQIFRAAHRIVLEEKRAQTHLQHALNGTGSAVTQPQTSTHIGSGVGTGTGIGGGGNGDGAGSSGQQQQHRHSSYGNTSLSYSACGVLNAANDGSSSCGVTAGASGSSNLLGSPHQKKIRFQLAKEKKASTTLGIIMSAFTICWLPFFILALIRPFADNKVPQSLSSLFLWLGYANSLLNPIIYATLNRDFRKPFQAILYFRCSSLNTMMRENYYQDQYGEPPSQRVMLGDERHGARESFL